MPNNEKENETMIHKRTMVVAISLALVLAVFATAALLDSERPSSGSVRVLLASEVEWQSLNPLRGDKSPRAGTLWGDRGAPVPCGFLVKFVDGFSSPPHIHPVTYRGIVLSGVVHNDEPQAEERWLPSGSFWTQPAGEVHITAAKGSHNVAYIEIEKGPYLVLPAKDAFEPPETPVWLELASMDWVDPPGLPASAEGPKLAALPGNPQDEQLRRSLVKLPAGFDGSVRSKGSTLHAVVIQGRPQHKVAGKTDVKTLDPGSYFGSEGEVAHQVSCGAGEGCLIYLRTRGTFDIIPTPPK